jgi:hypothetical protein
MSIRRRSLTDSLQLLVDTICNLFGSIVIISLLMAVVSKDTTTDAAAASARTAELRRQVEQTQSELDDARRLQSRLTTDTNDLQRLSLAAQIAELKTISASNEAFLKTNALTIAQLPHAEPASMDDLLKRKSALGSDLKSITNQISRLKQASVRQLRLPREHATGKKTCYIIVRYGKLYPVDFISGDHRELNTQTLDWRETADGQTAIPRRDLGLDTAAGLTAFARLFNDIPAATYSIHFLVYEDSFAAFLTARKIPLARNYDTGWEFFAEGRPIIFSSSGEPPPAL